MGVLGMYEDITERKAAEDNLRRTNRALKTLSAGNEALVRATDEDGLLRAMMRILVEVGGYAMAWVGYALTGPDRLVEPKACVGVDEARLRATRLSWADDKRDQEVVGAAIRTRELRVIRDVAADPGFAPWFPLVPTQDVRTVLGLPLRFPSEQTAFGALGIGASDLDAFDADELRFLQELATDLAYGIANLRIAAERNAVNRKLRLSLEGTIGAMGATMESRDPYTAGHQRRVAALARAIAVEMSLPAAVVDGIHFGALIHDLGKIQVPSEILAKPSRLSKFEFELIKTHSQAGYDIIKGVEFPWPVARMVLEHHERLDGSGYPQGLKGDAISL